ncbi:metal ABC transporter solute-binding protein, Zn/Mn family [Nakamurella sp.]|uniref:metal ABC transporter solute-binding protein, Zn/Mn family n=1 Tax=Nakamurella sp. TaxID=1869182 RepID=UPI003B3B7444
MVNNSHGRRRLGTALLGGAVALTLAACSGGGSGAGGTTAAASGSAGAGGGTVKVVAATNVWGDVVEQIGGDHVEVTSIITDPSADPHSFQSSPRNQLALSSAQLIVQNGGGYDDFMQTMISSAGSQAPVVTAVDASGVTPQDGELNEHVWYDLPGTIKVADAIAAQLATIDPANASTYRANSATFDTAVNGLITQAQAINAAHDGAPVAITEPVPVYLLESAGLSNVTPAEFSEAIENETDVPAAVMNQTLALFADKQVKLLAYNEQTTGPQTEQVLEAAKTNGIPTVPVTETLPDGQDYLSWMKSNIQALSQALGG